MFVFLRKKNEILINELKKLIVTYGSDCWMSHPVADVCRLFLCFNSFSNRGRIEFKKSFRGGQVEEGYINIEQLKHCQSDHEIYV
jgi:hypothetical protein